MQPIYNCLKDGVVQECSAEYICGGQSSPQIAFTTDTENPYSLNNWVQ